MINPTNDSSGAFKPIELYPGSLGGMSKVGKAANCPSDVQAYINSNKMESEITQNSYIFSPSQHWEVIDNVKLYESTKAPTDEEALALLNDEQTVSRNTAVWMNSPRSSKVSEEMHSAQELLEYFQVEENVNQLFEELGPFLVDDQGKETAAALKMLFDGLNDPDNQEVWLDPSQDPDFVEFLQAFRSYKDQGDLGPLMESLELDSDLNYDLFTETFKNHVVSLIQKKSEILKKELGKNYDFLAEVMISDLDEESLFSIEKNITSYKKNGNFDQLKKMLNRMEESNVGRLMKELGVEDDLPFPEEALEFFVPENQERLKNELGEKNYGKLIDQLFVEMKESELSNLLGALRVHRDEGNIEPLKIWLGVEDEGDLKSFMTDLGL